MKLPERRYGLTSKQAHEVWDVLVELAGAVEQHRVESVRYLADPLYSWSSHEYRFVGLLGFGGKLHFSDYDGAYVSCYPEHRNEVRDAIIEAVNERLRDVAPPRDELIRRAA